jgi:hypothetical protein
LTLVAALVVAALLAPAGAAADPTYGVMNADGGIYWRSGPDWNTAVAVSGNGFYPGTTIAVHCYQAGAGNVPGSADTMWEQATVVAGPGTGSGWVNEHFINDGQPINQPSPGVPPCNAPAPTPAPTPTPTPASTPAPSSNHCPAFTHREDLLGGVRVHAYVGFRASDTCNGRHVKDAYIHIVRECGPRKDPGRWYTNKASSPSDTRLHSVSGWIFDSVVSGCNTNTYYGYDYF